MRALSCYRKPDTWIQIMHAGMKQDFSWKHSARLYIELYETVLAQHASETITEPMPVP